MMTDPVADMLTRIRNAQAVKKQEVILPYSKLKLNILNLLKVEGWVGDVEVIKGTELPKGRKATAGDISAQFDRIKLGIVYKEDKQPKIKSIQKVSKPGKRVYTTKNDLPKVLNGWGMAVISTSKGLMTDRAARKANVGGEIILEIY